MVAVIVQLSGTFYYLAQGRVGTDPVQTAKPITIKKKERIKAPVKLQPRKESPVKDRVSANKPKPRPRVKAAGPLLGSATTRFNHREVSRVHNIRKAAAAIDGYVLGPGETFSFNGVVGPRTTAKGFRTARVIVNKKYVEGVGGGICQVSSTLFMAVRKSRLVIVERYGHSLAVGYVPRGSDATVAWGSKDFKFRNNYGFPVVIRASVQGGRMTISIYRVKLLV